MALGVAAARVRDAARHAAPGSGARHAALPPLVPGYRPNMLDGHPRAARAQRLAERRRTGAAPGPGPMLVGVDQPPRLATAVVLCEDGHAQERSGLGQGQPWVTQEALWRAARNCGPGDVLWGMAARGGSLVRRQPGQQQGPWGGSRPSKGAIDTGQVSAQRIALVHAQGATLTLRRMPVALQEPPREGIRMKLSIDHSRKHARFE